MPVRKNVSGTWEALNPTLHRNPDGTVSPAVTTAALTLSGGGTGPLISMTSTGLTYIGARAYDPQTAQFISPDPMLKPGDPQDLNPYDYAEDNPEANADPSGDMLCETGGPCGSAQALENYNDQQSSQDTSSSSGGFDPLSVLNPGCAGNWLQRYEHRRLDSARRGQHHPDSQEPD
jgi:RHS repeat-associated protein